MIGNANNLFVNTFLNSVRTFTESFRFLFAERETGDQAEMGIAVAGQTAEGHHPGVQGGLRAEHHGQAAASLCAK